MYAEDADTRLSTNNMNNTTIIFANNIAKSNGGALYLNNSYIYETTLVTFAHNAVSSAEGKGGAIYVKDDSSCRASKCFLQINANNAIQFIKNSATYGPVLYGGMLDRCFFQESNINMLGRDYFKNVSAYKPTLSSITSDQVRICVCKSESQIDCNTREINTTKMRGETIKLTAISVDQDENPGLSIIRAFYVEPLAELDVGEWRNTANRRCTNLSYHIFTIESSATLVLQLLDKCQDSPLSTITVHIQLTTCSRGFELINDRCTCDRRLAQYFDVCNIDTRSVKRKGPTWLRYDQHHFKLSTNCPLDYCTCQVSSPTISLLSPDQQCANHRSGVLCGACKDNYSITLGGSKCSRCTSSYSAIGWTVLFAVAGLALVALLLVCNMTISASTLNGLIFYANVVSISGLTSLHNCSLCPILRVFLAWLNLHGLGTADLLLFWHGHLPQDVAPVGLPYLHLVSGHGNHTGQSLLLHSHESLWHQQHRHTGHSLHLVLHQNTQDHHNSSQCHTGTTESPRQHHSPAHALQSLDLRRQHGIPKGKACGSLCSGSLLLALPLPALHSAADIRSMCALHVSQEVSVGLQVCTKYGLRVHHGCLPCTLQQETSILDWTHVTDTLSSLPCICLQLWKY